MVSKPKKKRGGQANYVSGRDGKPIVGLSCSSNRFYATHSKPRKWLGSDFDSALVKFREWESQQTAAMVEVKYPLPPSSSTFFSERYLETRGRPTKKQTMPEDAFWAEVRRRITENPQLAAEKTGLPLDRLHQFKEPQDSPTLKSIGETYIGKAQITIHERRKSKLYWDEFRKAVKVKTVGELTQVLIADYYDEIMGAGQSQTYVKHRFGKVKTVLNFAIKRGIAAEDINTVLAYCRILNPPKANAADPHPISVMDFDALYAAADDKWKAILLLALNCCMYGKEVADLEKPEIDLAKKVLITDRNKTGVTRVATLWGRTVDAIRNLPKHERSHLVLSQNGAPYHPDHVRRGFVRLRKLAGLGTDVKISDIRDGAYTAAVQSEGVEFEKARILAGHRTGMSDHYIKRNPKMVATACNAIESHYFPKPKTKKAGKK